ncbi:HIT family protein [Neobacillus cucumis]|uniref:Diadenosine tetraphosphate hydrolase n=1 Tax=Neobacillus cucumis TaxID=1740721 RepID=A0A2N5H7K0_9BACI|nr:HIT family protein [Neobacillus cucumis]PLS01495.1 diadenosine tetraphosphate hydrolase [Neobacillus cucumis]
MTECPICEKHKQLVNPIFEDEDWIVNPGPLSSQILGYMYIEPKRHVENWSELTDEEMGKVGLLIKRLEQALKRERSVNRVYVVTISEAVRHLHFHIIPRAEGMTTKGLDLIEQATQQKVKGQSSVSEESYMQFLETLRKHFY